MPPWMATASLDGLRERWAPCLFPAVAGHTDGGAGSLIKRTLSLFLALAGVGRTVSCSPPRLIASTLPD